MGGRIKIPAKPIPKARPAAGHVHERYRIKGEVVKYNPRLPPALDCGRRLFLPRHVLRERVGVRVLDFRRDCREPIRRTLTLTLSLSTWRGDQRKHRPHI